MPREITKDQHFVPKFYLRGFTNDSGLLEILDLRNHRFLKPKSVAGVAKDRFFYVVEQGQRDEVSQRFEDSFGAFEDALAKIWGGIVDRAERKCLDPGDFHRLVEFISMQLLRTRSFQRTVALNYEQIDRILGKARWERVDANDPATLEKFKRQLGDDLTAEGLEDVKRALVEGSYDLTYNNAGFLKNLQDNLEWYADKLYFQQWTIFHSRTKYGFVTSDNPVAEWSPRREGFHGNNLIQRKHYIALSPSILIELKMPKLLDPFPNPDDEWPGAPSPHDSVCYTNLEDKDEVLVYNGVLIDHGADFAYSGTRSELEEIHRQVSNPGRAFQLYFQRYVLTSERWQNRMAKTGNRNR